MENLENCVLHFPKSPLSFFICIAKAGPENSTRALYGAGVVRQQLVKMDPIISVLCKSSSHCFAYFNNILSSVFLTENKCKNRHFFRTFHNYMFVLCLLL